MSANDERKISLLGHLTSVVSFAFVTINLLFWFPLLLIAAVIRLVAPVEMVKRTTSKMVENIYRYAVFIDAWWFLNVLDIHFDIEDSKDVLANLTHGQTPVIICNHQSWFDIFLLQTLICRQGPILKFVIKSELLWVPVLGWICLVLNFPRLNRKGDRESRSKDLNRVTSASLSLSQEPGGLLIFPEGTRFNEEKQQQQSASLEHLLRPKIGGLSAIRGAMPMDTMVLDISIRYQEGEANCWRCMSKGVSNIRVKIDSYELGEINDTSNWLNQIWSTKDKWLAPP